MQTVPGLGAEVGGPGESIPNLCSALAGQGLRVALVTSAGSAASRLASLPVGVELHRVHGVDALAGWGPDFGRRCRRAARDARLLHSHGLWLYPNVATGAVAREAGLPHVVSPRGMLAPWALARSRWRKRLVWALRQRRELEAAGMIHVTSVEEGREVRAAGLEAPLAVVPNGVDADRFGPREEEGEALLATLLGRVPERRPVLFLSRIHPKKGIELLLDAWGMLGKRGHGWTLVIAGPGEPRHVRDLKRRIRRLGSEHVVYVGPVYGPQRAALLAAAAVLVLPSHSENYGMVVAEALASGRPVITTTKTPWKALAESGCGWWVEPSADGVTGALRDALGRDESELARMGSIGRQLVVRSHSLAEVGERMLAAYEWLLEGGAAPECVVPRGAAT